MTQVYRAAGQSWGGQLLAQSTTFSYNQGAAGSPSGLGAVGSAIVKDPLNRQTRYYVDGQGRTVMTMDPMNWVTQTMWTNDNHPSEIIKPAGGTVQYTYSQDGYNNLLQATAQVNPPNAATQTLTSTYSGYPADGPTDPRSYLPTALVDPDGNETDMTYNALGQVLTETQNAWGGHPATTTTTYYQPSDGPVLNGLRKSVQRPLGGVWTYTYYTSGAQAGLLETETPPSPLGSQSMTYDAANRSSTVTDGNGVVTSYTYDAFDRTVAEGTSNGTSAGASFDADGNKLTTTDASGTTTYTVDALGQPRTQTLVPPGTSSPSQSITYGYDAAGEMSTKTETDAANNTTSTTYGYNADGQQGQVANGSTITDMGYDLDGNQTSVTVSQETTSGGYGSQIATTQMTYDLADRLLTKVSSTPVNETVANERNIYTYGNGTPSQYKQFYVDQTGISHGVTYDYAGRILTDNTCASTTPTFTNCYAANFSYTYDADGNVTYKGTNAGTASITVQNSFNLADEASSSYVFPYGTQPYTQTYQYDGNGNRTSSSSGGQWGYDGFNQMTNNKGTRTAWHGGEVAASGCTNYQHDAQGVSEVNNTCTQSDLMVTMLADGTVIIEHGWQHTYTELTDENGNVTAIVDENGNKVNS